MIKLIAIAFTATALAACSNMGTRAPSSSMGASGTMNSTDSQAQKSGNASAVSPGGAAGGSAGK